mgnify:FL=1
MKKAQFLFLVVAFAALFQYQLFANTPTRGFWMWGSSLTNSNITSIVNKLSDNYANEVYLLVKGTNGTKTDPTILTNFITQAHAKSIKVHLWYCVFQDNVYLISHPDARVYHCPNPAAGYNRPYRMDSESYVNPLYPGYKEYVLNNIGYFLNNFDCDGIHLDYIRYGHLVYSFDSYSLKKAADLGCDTTRLLSFFNTSLNYQIYAVGSGFVNLYSQKDSDVVKWVNMRKDAISDYISAIRDTIEKVKPGIKLTAAFMPEGVGNPNSSDVHYAQNYTLHSTWLDMIAPMSYFKSYDQPTSWLQSITSNAIDRVVSTCKITAGLQAFGGVTATELDEQIVYALEGGSHGVLIFKYEDITDNNKWNVIKNRFQSLSAVTNVSADFFKLENYPNPFSSSTVIKFQVAKPCVVSLTVYDAMGKKIMTLINQNMSPGFYNVNFNGNELSDGIYFYSLEMDGLKATKKMILMR